MKDNLKGNKKERNKNFYYSLFFLGVVILLYLVLSVLDSENIYRSLRVSFDIFIQIIPILIFIIILMGFLNYLLKPRTISRYLGKKSGVKGWCLAVSFGILSHGPIYLWYPLLSDLRNHGMRIGLVAVFLYNRAIKIPLLPIMIFYFGIVFVIILTIYMVVASVVEGIIIEIIEPR